MQIWGGKGFWAEDTKSTEVLKRDASLLKGIADEKEMKSVNSLFLSLFKYSTIGNLRTPLPPIS